ncbi:hypothetical protein HK100_010354 [Physocladia obscura]|uniref:N-acetyltransferase domain-containing protein n=1 Tax=Physocladia obscura TaxID=109957 RepID=A0AAD5X9V5_9FUNG|nr:hypothetical protein HK100_010354 [Physocladia obscura]
MTFTVSVCSVNDGNGLARTNMSAYWQDVNWRLMWEDKSLEYVTKQNAKRWPRNLTIDSRKRHLKAVNSQTGQIVGYVRFILPETLSDEWLEAKVPQPTEQEAADYLALYISADYAYSNITDHMDEPVTEMKNIWFSKKNYIVLDHLAVHPEYQRRGIATMLLRPGLSFAEKTGFDVFALATEIGAATYLKLGFTVLETLVQDYTSLGGVDNYKWAVVEHKSGQIDDEGTNK